MDLNETRDEYSAEGSFDLAIDALLRYGTNHAYLSRDRLPTNATSQESIDYYNHFLTFVELGLRTGLLELADNYDLIYTISQLENKTGRDVLETKRNIPAAFGPGELVPLPIDAFLHKDLRFNPEIFLRFNILRDVLEEMSRLPCIEQMIPIVHGLLNARLDDLDEENEPNFRSSIKPIVISGVPGVGKTTIAENLPRFLRAIGITNTSRNYRYLPESEIRSGVGATQASLIKILTTLKGSGDDKGGILIVDDFHDVASDSRDSTFSYKFNTMKMLMAELSDLQKDGVFVIFVGERKGIADLFTSNPDWEEKVYTLEIKAPSIDALVTHVAAYLSSLGISLFERFSHDLKLSMEKLQVVHKEKFGNWKIANAYAAELRKLSKGNRILGNGASENKYIDGPRLAQACANIGLRDPSFLEEVSSPEVSAAEIAKGVQELEAFVQPEGPNL